MGQSINRQSSFSKEKLELISKIKEDQSSNKEFE
jgi:hypothetical protein